MILFTDTDTDFTPETAKEFGYELISMPFMLGEETIHPFKDTDTFDYKTFYDTLRSGVIPTSYALNSDVYREIFEPYFAKGEDILYVHFSRSMTVSFDAMDMAIKELKAEYPNVKFYSIDTKGITILSYVIVKEIGKLYKKGATIEEIMDWANKEVDKFAVYFYADNLKFFGRSGRVTGLAAFMGNLIGIKPIIHINDNGVMTNIAKEKGRKKAIDRLLSYVIELGDNIKDYTFVIGHSDYLEFAQSFGALLKEKFGEDLDIEYVIVNPTCGGHCGPDCIGVSFHAKHR
jgi:DegV family protein with EDD domain